MKNFLRFRNIVESKKCWSLGFRNSAIFPENFCKEKKNLQRVNESKLISYTRQVNFHNIIPCKQAV